MRTDLCHRVSCDGSSDMSCDQEDARRRRTIDVCRHFPTSIIVRSVSKSDLRWKMMDCRIFQSMMSVVEPN
jgi:hypothetical protein